MPTSTDWIWAEGEVRVVSFASVGTIGKFDSDRPWGALFVTLQHGSSDFSCFAESKESLPAVLNNSAICSSHYRMPTENNAVSRSLIFAVLSCRFGCATGCWQSTAIRPCRWARRSTSRYHYGEPSDPENSSPTAFMDKNSRTRPLSVSSNWNPYWV